MRFGTNVSHEVANWPLYVALALGGVPIVIELLFKIFNREFGSDLLAGISIVTSVLLDEYLAGTLVVLMLSGGEAIESYAVRSAASVLRSLAKRMPSVAHRRRNSQMEDVPLAEIAVDDALVVFPHEICPVDGEVIEGHGVMDESYLTGEPYRMSKTPGATVLSGSINGDAALVIRATRRAVDSRYAQIMRVMQESEQRRPRIRRLADQLGALYTPLAVAIAVAAWIATGQPLRFLAVLVVATPCPLLIAIPVAIIGSISLAARRGIIVRDPAVLEQVDTCRTVIFDKTGTLTYGEPQLVEQLVAPGFEAHDVLMLAASLERYSKHPLAEAILAEAQSERLAPSEAAEIRERPGEGLRGTVGGRNVQITSRNKLAGATSGIGGAAAAVGRRVGMRVCGRRQVRGDVSVPRSAAARGIVVRASFGAEASLRSRAAGVRRSRKRSAISGRSSGHQRRVRGAKSGRQSEHRSPRNAAAKTLFLGDGINDAPALLAATVGLAFGTGNEITGDASGAVVMDTSLERVDEFMHISRRMRVIALQSAIGGMAASLLGMMFAAAGYLPPVAGAILQEVIDIVAVTNAVRAAWPPKSLSDFE